MSKNNGSGLGDQERNTLERLLEGRSDGFKATVLDLVVRNHWDVNDPSFQILLATGQMEVLLEQFPQEFEALFRELLEEQRQQFEGMQQYLDTQNSDVKSYLQGVEATGSELVSGVSDQVTALRQFATGQRTQLEKDVGKVLKLAQEEREELQRELGAQLQVASENHLIAVAREATRIHDAAGTQQRAKYIKELIPPMVAGVVVISVIGVWAGTALGKSWAYSERAYQWGTRMWEWNHKQYNECVKQERKTCNFHIVTPEEW